MTESKYVYDVNADQFQQRVLDRSAEVPVLVDFWADWCQPCRMLAPILEELAEEYQGKIQVAKIDTEAAQELALQFGVRSLPTVKLIRHSEVVDEFVGVLPPAAIRSLLEQHVTRESDLLREQARGLLESGQAAEAVEVLSDAARSDPDNARIIPDLVEALIDCDRLDEAEEALNALPFARRMEEPATGLFARIRFRREAHGAKEADTGELKERVREHPEDLAARTQLAAQLVIAGELEAAMGEYLEIMRRDRSYQDEAGRKGLIGVFDLLGDDDPRVADFRRRMFAMMH